MHTPGGWADMSGPSPVGCMQLEACDDLLKRPVMIFWRECLHCM